VKWWLLAIPHYLVIAFFAGGWGPGRSNGRDARRKSGLITVLAIIAAVVRLFWRPLSAPCRRLCDGDEPLVLAGARLRRAHAG
jgi:hypothetical protein